MSSGASRRSAYMNHASRAVSGSANAVTPPTLTPGQPRGLGARRDVAAHDRDAQAPPRFSHADQHGTEYPPGRRVSMATHARDTLEVGYDEFCGALAAKDLQPLWTQAARLMPPKPIPRT